MCVNSLSLVAMIISYAIIIYKVRKSSKAMAKYQLTIRNKVSLPAFFIFLSLHKFVFELIHNYKRLNVNFNVHRSRE